MVCEEVECIFESSPESRRTVLEPLQVCVQHASGLGFVSYKLAVDGTYRTTPNGTQLTEVVQQSCHLRDDLLVRV